MLFCVIFKVKGIITVIIPTFVSDMTKGLNYFCLLYERKSGTYWLLHNLDSLQFLLLWDFKFWQHIRLLKMRVLT